MIVTAVRDDGSLLVDTDRGAFLVTPQGVLPVQAQSALARGTWDDPPDPPPDIPADARQQIQSWPPEPLGHSDPS